jgi:endonuclease III related protein
LQRLSQKEALRAYYGTLFRAWGPQHWWPARTRLEMIVGAYLTQNTAWTNVERALSSLRSGRVLSLDGVRRTPLPKLESLVRPAGYFRQKARRLKIFVGFLDDRYGGSLSRMLSEPTEKLREELLSLNGVGPETADSILLYAGNHPVFVVDAYTRRILERHHILPGNADYEEVRGLCERALKPVASQSLRAESEAGGSPLTPPVFRGSSHQPSPVSKARRTALTQVYNEMHGLLVRVGKHYCLKSKPRCEECPLGKYLPEKSQGASGSE